MSIESQASTAAKLEQVMAALRAYSETVQRVPQGADFKYNNAFRGFPRAMKRHAAALQEMMTKVSGCNFNARRATDFTKVSAPSAKHTATMEAVDALLEVVDHLLDEVRGDKQRAEDQHSVVFGRSGGNAAARGGVTLNADFATKFARNLRPQADFELPPDNSHAPFQPPMFDAASQKLVRGPAGHHPYQAALDQLQYAPHQLSAGTETPFLAVDDTPLACVETEEELGAMIDELKQVAEIAVDLEHHSYHSYQGFTCLIQISTRTKDYVVDALALRSHLHRLNVVLTDPKIVKVFHAAHEDIRWLQKDFGCYVVNMFDTALALQAMHMPHSLAFLVDHFCQVKLDKTYQTADWRVRPLPLPLVTYARQDTHYLLYCYDRLRSLLISSTTDLAARDTHGTQALGNLLVHVLADSKRRCGTMYEKPLFDPNQTWSVALGKSIGGLNQQQRDVAKLIFNWRDGVARAEDESPPAVLHTASVLTIATRLPITARDVIRTAHPATLPLRRDAAALAADIAAIVGEVASPASPNSAMATGPTGSAVWDGAAQPAAASKLVHRPMTGTLPSCEPRREVSSALAPIPSWYRQPSGLIGGGDAASPHPTQASNDPLLRLVLSCARDCGSSPGLALARLTSALPCPGVNLSMPRKADLSSANRRQVAAKADDDKAEDAVAAGDEEVTPAAKTHRAEAAGAAVESKRIVAQQEAPADRSELPKSLREQYGGLGRDTRRRARRE